MPEVPPFLWSDAGTFPAPKRYTVPGAGEVMPYTATATYTNASGQAILPALRIKSAEGALLALTFPVGQTIADGASSEVTFVPPCGSAGSAAAAAGFTPKIAYAGDGFDVITVLAGTNADIDWFTFVNPEGYYSATAGANGYVSLDVPSTAPTTAQYYVTANISAHRPFFAAGDPADIRFYLRGMSANFATDAPSVVSRATTGASLTGWSWLWDTVTIGASYSARVYNDSGNDYIVAVQRSIVVTQWDSF